MNIPGQLLYTKEHEWVALEGNRARVGISDYAQEQLGDITFVELPAKGTRCQQFKEMATVESVKAVSDIYAPMSGTVAETNEAVMEKPELANESPFEEGWLVVLEVSDESEKENLMTAEEYENYCKENT